MYKFCCWMWCTWMLHSYVIISTSAPQLLRISIFIKNWVTSGCQLFLYSDCHVVHRLCLWTNWSPSHLCPTRGSTVRRSMTSISVMTRSMPSTGTASLPVRNTALYNYSPSNWDQFIVAFKLHVTRMTQSSTHGQCTIFFWLQDGLPPPLHVS